MAEEEEECEFVLLPRRSQEKRRKKAGVVNGHLVCWETSGEKQVGQSSR